jgi:transcriptional regulator with XRE-family HTH domain
MEFKEFGQWLYELRKEHNLTYEELVNKINIPKVQVKNLRKWERSLEYPDLDTIYKLSEIFKIPSEELLSSKEETLKKGIGKINVRLIRTISYILNVSIYTAIWITRISLALALIIAWLYFIRVCKQNGVL